MASASAKALRSSSTPRASSEASPSSGFAAAWDRLLLAHSDDSGTDQGWDIHLATAQRTTISRGDYDGNGLVDGSDLAYLLAGWGQIGPDLDGDGQTNGLDLTILLGGWGD